MGNHTIKTGTVHKENYINFWKKTLEFRESMRMNMIEKRWNAASLCAIHASISANDAVLVFFHGIKSTSQKHSDAAKLLKSLIQHKETGDYASHLIKLINAKNIVEYEARLFRQDETYTIVKHAERFITWVESLLPNEI